MKKSKNYLILSLVISSLLLFSCSGMTMNSSPLNPPEKFNGKWGMSVENTTVCYDVEFQSDNVIIDAATAGSLDLKEIAKNQGVSVTDAINNDKYTVNIDTASNGTTILTSYTFEYINSTQILMKLSMNGFTTSSLTLEKK